MKIRQNPQPNFRKQAVSFLQGDDSVVYRKNNSKSIKTEPSQPIYTKHEQYYNTASSQKSLNTCEDSQILKGIKTSSKKKSNLYHSYVSQTDRYSVDLDFQAFSNERTQLGRLISPNIDKSYKLKEQKSENAKIKISQQGLQNSYNKKLVKLGNNLIFEKGHSLRPQFTKERRKQLANMDISSHLHNSFGEKENDPVKQIENCLKQKQQEHKMLTKINDSLHQDTQNQSFSNLQQSQLPYIEQKSQSSQFNLESQNSQTNLNDKNEQILNEIENQQKIIQDTNINLEKLNQNNNNIINNNNNSISTVNNQIQKSSRFQSPRILYNRESSEVFTRNNSQIIPTSTNQIRSSIFKNDSSSKVFKNQKSLIGINQTEEWGFKVNENSIKKNIESQPKFTKSQKLLYNQIKLPKIPIIQQRDDITYPEQYPVSYKFVQNNSPKYTIPKSQVIEKQKDTPDTYMPVKKFFEAKNHGKVKQKEQGYQKHYQKMMKDIHDQVNEEIKQSKELKHPLPPQLRNTPLDEEFAIQFDREYRKKLLWAKKALNNLKLKIRDMAI